jgi:hypothetical protein
MNTEAPKDSTLEAFVEVETLYWYDGPRLLTAYINGVFSLLVNTEDDGKWEYCSAAVTPELIGLITTNKAPLFDGYANGPFHKVTFDLKNGGPPLIEVLDAFPEDHKPDPDVLLVYEPAKTDPPTL